jgi:hypothetical protein
MLDIRLWQHKETHAVYAVRYIYDANHYLHVMQAAGPLASSEFDTALHGFDDDPDLAEEIDQHQFDYQELPQPHTGTLHDVRRDVR